MMSDHDIRALADHMKRAGIGVLEVTQPGQRLRLRMRDAGAAPAAPVKAAPADDPVVVPSDAVGFFRRRHPDGVFAAVEVGATLEASQIMGFLQVGLLLRPVIAGRRGTLSRILALDDGLVGYGTPLFELQGLP